MKKTIIFFISIIISTNIFASSPSSKSTKAQKEIEQYVEQLERDSLFSRVSWSLMIKEAKTGKIIAQKDPQLYLAGASITKLLTTGIALSTLGEDYKYQTRLEYSGEIQDSTLIGTLYIIGGGDPTLGSDYDEFAYITDSTFYHWKKALNAAGIAHIEGRIVGDSRYFTNEISESWTWDDFDTYYGTSVLGLSYFENKMFIYLSPNAQIGQAPRVDSIYPANSTVKIINNATTVEGNRNSIYSNASPLHPQEHFLTGSIGQKRTSVRKTVSNRTASLSLLTAFMSYMEKQTVPNNVEYQVWETNSKDIDTLSERHLIYTHYSPTLKEIVAVTNKYSDNMYAETILRTIGKEKIGNGSTSSSLSLEVKYLEDMAKGASSIYLDGGSGLSRTTFLNADYYSKFLCAMTKTPVFEAYHTSLAVPGENGTFKNVLKDCPTKNRLNIKSGTLSGVKGYSGYAGEGESMLCFVIMVNRYHDVSEINDRLMPLLELMSKY